MLATEILLLLLYAAIEFAVGLFFAWAFARMFQVKLSKRKRLWIATAWAVLGVIPTVLGINGGL
ncbi:hypothetical protein [Alicyclobacillus acidocaldarius]|uniref:Uncharacterized protein n=1 Tax=Alicyclobacillus acidocaldarius (strain Tc-4-1) TaxID=1048834 RepID=F8IHS4_ALIAT|nr:hypothetical protein [Alicyclobacillus acidocaldarius]AEJ42041.1 hypothetical protein TC41_0061 [Alicyclobacillus acidocaldarius subsp. acidocaldarius Tc-4-1]